MRSGSSLLGILGRCGAAIFDQMILSEALARGATLIPGRALKPILNDNGGVRGVRVRPRACHSDQEAWTILPMTFLASSRR